MQKKQHPLLTIPMKMVRKLWNFQNRIALIVATHIERISEHVLQAQIHTYISHLPEMLLQQQQQRKTPSVVVQSASIFMLIITTHLSECSSSSKTSKSPKSNCFEFNFNAFDRLWCVYMFFFVIQCFGFFKCFTISLKWNRKFVVPWKRLNAVERVEIRFAFWFPYTADGECGTVLMRLHDLFVRSHLCECHSHIYSHRRNG